MPGGQGGLFELDEGDFGVWTVEVGASGGFDMVELAEGAAAGKTVFCLDAIAGYF